MLVLRSNAGRRKSPRRPCLRVCIINKAILVLRDVICLVAHPLKRWKKPKTCFENVLAIKRVKNFKEGLLQVEVSLQRIMLDLQMSMLTDIRRAQASDRDALMALFRETNGPSKVGGWVNKEGWGTSLALSKWHGVTVDDAGRVLKLDLRDNNLTGGLHTALEPQKQGLLLWVPPS